MEPVLGGLLRVIYALKQVEDGAFIIDARMDRYFHNNCGLSLAQIDYVKNLSVELSK